MAMVPKYQPSVAERPAFQQSLTTQATPNDFGATIGAGMQNLAQGAQQAAAAMAGLSELESIAAAKDHEVQLSDWDREAKYGPGGFLTLSGKAAVEARASYEKTLKEKRLEFGQGLSPQAQQHYKASSEALVQSSLETAIVHTANERKTYIIDSSNARLSTFADDALAAWNKPGLVNKSIQQGIDELNQQGQLLGWGADVLKVKTEAYTSTVISNVILRIAEDDPIAAAEALVKSSKRISALDGYALTNKLLPLVENAAARDAVAIPGNTVRAHDAMNAGQGPTQARAFLTERLVTKGRTEDVEGLDGGFANSLAALIDNAPASMRDGLGILSGARSNERQQVLWDAALAKYGSADEARKWVAPPGRSQHNHGQAVDLSYNGQSLANAPNDVVAWVHEHASDYGLTFPLANEIWHVEPVGARDGSTTAAGKGVQFSPRIENLLAAMPADNAAQIREKSATALAKQHTADVAQAKVDYTQYKDAVALSILTGDTTSEHEILNDATLDDGDKTVLLRSFRTEQAAGAGARQYLVSLGDGSAKTLNPFNADDQKLVDKSFELFVGAVPTAQRPAATLQFVTQSGMVPKDVVATLRMGLNSTDVRTVTAALSQSAALADTAPIAVGNIPNGKQITDAAASYKELVSNRGMSVEEAAAQVIALRDPANIAKADVLKATWDKAVKDNAFPVTDVLGAFGDNMLPGGPVAGLNVYQEQALTSDYLMAAERALKGPANGDVGIAKQIALKEMARTYGISKVSGQEVVTKFPPENFYPAIDGSQDYIRDLALKDARTIAPDAANVMLVPTPETSQDVRAGKAPRYSLLYQGPNGVWDAVPSLFVIDAKSIADLSALDSNRRQIEFNIQRLQTEMNRSRPARGATQPDALQGGGFIDHNDEINLLRSKLTGLAQQRETALGKSPIPAVANPAVANPDIAASDAESQFLQQRSAAFGALGGAN